MIMRRWGFALLFVWVVSACGDQSTDATFQFNYDSNAAAILGDGTGISVRAFYSFDNLLYRDANSGQTQQGFIVEPSSAGFVFETANINNVVVTSFKQNTAQAAGYSFQDGSFTLHSMSLNHTGTFIGIDFLKQLSDGKFYVVAFACVKSSGVMNKDLLQSFTSTPLIVQRGRNCGKCEAVNDYGSSVESAKNPCP